MNPAPPPSLTCRELPDYRVDDLDAVRAAFTSAEDCPLRQAWRAEPETGFAPATVRTGWHGDTLRLFVELEDRDIFTRATACNQRMWELGDVVEMFLQPADSAAYVELHITPNNLRLQLLFPDTATLRRAQVSGAFEEFMLADGVFESRAWPAPAANKWYAHAEIAAALVGEPDRLPAAEPWRFSVSRYDYTRGRSEPVVSSTSPHAQPDFHRREDWGTLRFSARQIL